MHPKHCCDISSNYAVIPLERPIDTSSDTGVGDFEEDDPSEEKSFLSLSAKPRRVIILVLLLRNELELGMKIYDHLKSNYSQLFAAMLGNEIGKWPGKKYHSRSMKVI